MTTCCRYCGRSMRPAKHELHAGLVAALQLLHDRVKERQVAMLKFPNEVHIRTELQLSRDQWSNFSKLKWLGLVCQYRVSGRKMPRGYWGLTKTGIDFLAGTRKIQQGVKTFNKKVVEDFGPLVGIQDFVRKEPTWEVDAPPVEAAKEKQLTLE